MDWGVTGPNAAHRYEADNTRLGEDLAPKRDADIAGLAPVLVAARNELARETILLPDGGKGFSLDGDAIDETIGGVRYQRTVSLRDGRFEMTATTRSAEGEISYAEAQAADRKTDELFNRAVFIRLPQTPKLRTASPAPPVANPLAEALGPVIALDHAGKPEAALAALDKLKLGDAFKADAAGVRGTLLARLNRKDEADGAFDQALAIDRTNTIALQGKINLLLSRGDGEDAQILADRLVLVAPEKAEVYAVRGYVRRALKNPRGALADWDIAVQKGMTSERLLRDRAYLISDTGDDAKALAEAEALVRLYPQSARAYEVQANMLAVVGRREEAAKAAARSLQIEPTSQAYWDLLRYDLSGDAATTLGDMLAMIRLMPTQDLPSRALHKVIGLPGAAQKLEAAYDTAKPEDAEAADEIAEAREEVAAAAGEPQKLLALYDARTAAHPKDARTLNAACWARATLGVQLEKALADCDAAVKLEPVATYLDSRGLVRLRLKAYPAAIADYDAALKLDPKQSASLYGRGLAKLQAGDRAGGEADLAAARKIDPGVAEDFAGMGLRPRAPSGPR
jgi:tetratricopeptide (TPR) repeat protein